MKYLRISLTKYVKGLEADTYEMYLKNLMKA